MIYGISLRKVSILFRTYPGILMEGDNLMNVRTLDNSIFCDHYAIEYNTYDEMCSCDGNMRPHWESLVSNLRELGSKEMIQLSQEARRLLRENGVTYNIYGDSGGLNRPWELDLVPVLISKDEWHYLEAGLVQRARLLDFIIKDFYGKRELISRGIIPIELLYSHEGFLRPCEHVFLPGNHQLITYAADLARTPEGTMVVFEDRCQAPSGAGYTLENRTVVKRLLPNLFRDCKVHRISFFFHTLRRSLSLLSPHHKDNPTIVVLTPGPRNETYFEHAYLASYLGYTLVQGDDLTVRNARLWLKSIEGLKPVDVVVRRVDDSFCDPLELRIDSHLGVPGLLEAARQGNVTIVNPLGSNVLENPGLIPFLPHIARYFFDENLILQSVRTWWCGSSESLKYVLDNLERLIIKPIFRSLGDRAFFCPQMSNNELARLRERITSHPHLYVGQEEVCFSTTPSLCEGKLEPHSAVFCFFLVAGDNTYEVMPGGLTRTASTRSNQSVSNQAGGISKDIWILATEPAKHVSLWNEQYRIQIALSENAVLPSRAAENLFWVGRYGERAEGVARLLRIILHRLCENQEFNDQVYEQCLEALLRCLTQCTITYPGFVGKGGQDKIKAPEKELLSVTLDAKRNGTLSSTLKLLEFSAYNVRDLWSTDTWRIIDDIRQFWFVELEENPVFSRLQDKLDHLISILSAFTGLTMESMCREQGWQFLDVGRRLERALLLASLLRSTMVIEYEESVEGLVLESILGANESLMIYRRRYRDFIEPQSVLGVLVLDETNPRSLIYQINRLQKYISELPRLVGRQMYRLRDDERLILEASTRVHLTDLASLFRIVEGLPLRQELDQLLEKVYQLLTQTSYAISHTFFTHAQRPHQLVHTSRGTDE
jgi:uncharacterized circularly permuted ATP-grasp superfamily protein/uncharacterized alpha-E superfamily protein